jgi:L-rhamnose mutarotase
MRNISDLFEEIYSEYAKGNIKNYSKFLILTENKLVEWNQLCRSQDLAALELVEKTKLEFDAISKKCKADDNLYTISTVMTITLGILVEIILLHSTYLSTLTVIILMSLLVLFLISCLTMIVVFFKRLPWNRKKQKAKDRMKLCMSLTASVTILRDRISK